MAKKPVPGELVICRIIKINPHSAFAILEEYNAEGMIHISEVANGWVKDISQHVKEGQAVVAKVLSVDDNSITLSIKRVDRERKAAKLREYKKEKKAEKLIEIAAKKIKQTGKLDEIKDAIKEKFGSVSAAFELGDRTEDAIKAILNEKWAEAIKEIAEKSIQEKEYVFKANIKLISYEPDGIKRIVDVLKKCESEGIEVSYLSAPDYMLRFTSREAKKGGHEFTKKLEEIESYAKKSGCLKEIKAIK